jgi:hypothetical protein
MTLRISDLNSAQLARHAFNVFLFAGGRHATGGKLIYRALQLDPRNAEAIRCLSDFMFGDGTEVFSAVALEYGLSEQLNLTTAERKVLDDLLFISKWTWKFAKHKSGNPTLRQEDFADRSAFEVDEVRYQEFLKPLLDSAGSIEKAFNAAHTLSGILVGFLVHQDPSKKIGVEESLFPERFNTSPAFQLWLGSDTNELDALEESRQKRTIHGH